MKLTRLKNYKSRIPVELDRKKRNGCLIRSALLFQAEARDLEGISAVIDLRTPGERGEAPDQAHGRICYPLPADDEGNQKERPALTGRSFRGD